MSLQWERDLESANKFTQYVLSHTSLTPYEFVLLNTDLAKDPTLTRELINSPKYSDYFFSDFSERIERVLMLLGHTQSSRKLLENRAVNQNAIHNFAENFVVPLADTSYAVYHTSQAFHDLLVETTQLLYLYRKRGLLGVKSYITLLEKISMSQYLMRRILPSIDGAELIQTILAEAQAGSEIQSFGSTVIVTKWTNIAAELCGKCGNHAVTDELSRWRTLLCLRESLMKLLEAGKQWQTQSTYICGFKQSSLDAANPGVIIASPAAGPLTLSLSQEDLRYLALFDLSVPTGMVALEGTVTWLEEKETFRIFHTLIKSFPCLLCLRSDDIQPLYKTPQNKFSVATLQDSFTGILFGEKLGPWKISLGEKAFKDMQRSNKQGVMKKIARKFRELASGQWEIASLRAPLSPKMLEEAGEEEKVPLWRASYGSNGRILWQVNVGFDEDKDDTCNSQIITVWRVGTSDEVRESIRDVLRLQRPYNTSYMNNCRVDLTRFPVFPSPCSDDNTDTNNNSTVTDEVFIEAQGALMTNRFYCMTGKVLEELLWNPNSIEFPFDISKEETQIIMDADSAGFILGRSGTGKTTCLLFKLLCRTIASRESGVSLRQIFLTKSTFLAERLQVYLAKLIASQLGDPSTQPRSDVRGCADPEYILMESKDPLEDQTFDMKDFKFPLVCTFNQFYSFLEKLIQLYTEHNNPEDHSAHMRLRRVRRRINYEVYSTQYQPKYHRPGKLPEADLVFSEILGTIKGSTTAERQFKPLSREEYVNLRDKRAPVFTDTESRNLVYSLYEEYERKKLILGDRDDVDRVISLLEPLEKDQDLKAIVRMLFDEVYVDEIQDNKLLEVDLLLQLVRNPQGIHFAGDSAQCISRDNTFRLADIKSRHYQLFNEMAMKAGQPSWAKPTIFQLAKNYRSHQGILSLSADIIEMIHNGFPLQIDDLPLEVGNLKGPEPTVFLGFDHHILAQGGAGRMNGTSEGISSLGADQVIIVRNDIAKNALRDLLGKSTLILTIVQSKGLEFEDVILYDYFPDSLWGNVPIETLRLLMQKDAHTKLDSRKYRGLCSELKHLYVAVTRARRNLWIVESDPEAASNMVSVWTSTANGRKSLVDVIHAGGAEAEARAKSIIKPGRSTNPEAWIRQGELFFHRALYEEALICFTKAGHSQGETLATAYLRYEEASAFESDGNKVKARKLYLQAAEHFQCGGFIQKAAECWGAAREYRKAACLLQAHGEYAKAAPWYEKAKHFREAGTCYQQAELYDDAVRAYRKGDHFAELVKILNVHQEHVSKSVRERYSTLVNLLLQRGDLELPDTVIPDVIQTLGNGKAKEEFYIKFERTEDLLSLYRDEKRYYEAFKKATENGRFEEALHLRHEPQALMKEHEGSIPVSEYLILFNGLMTAYPLSINQPHPENMPLVDAPALFQPDNESAAVEGLHEARSGWEEILKCVRISDASTLIYPRPTQTAADACGNFFKEFGNEILDYLELLHISRNHVEVLPRITTIGQLPSKTMRKFATVAGDLLAKKENIPSATLLTCVGVLTFAHQPDQVIVLSSSPLFSEVSKYQPQTCTHITVGKSQALDVFSNWLIPIVARVIPQALKHMHALPSDGRHCYRALEGICPDQPSECTRGRHIRLTSEETRENIECLLEEVDLACSTARLYSHRKLDEKASEDHLPKRRFFLEKLRKGLTFLSPLLHDYNVQQNIWETITSIAPEAQWFHIRDGLASLCLYGLSPKERHRKGAYSFLLEQMELANKIGLINRFFYFPSLKANGENWSDFIRACHSLEPSRIGQLTAIEMCEKIDLVTTEMISWDLWGLRVFHSVLALLESISLELINRTVGRDILISTSRHNFIRDQAADAPGPSAAEKFSLDASLVKVLTRLCSILSYLPEELEKKSQGLLTNKFEIFEACGRPIRNGNRYMIRRAFDHLALCMINIGLDVAIPPKGYYDLWKIIQQAYSSWYFPKQPSYLAGTVRPSHITWNAVSKPEQLADQICDTYRKYNKDELIIIPKGRARFRNLGVRVISKEKNNIPITVAPEARDPSDANEAKAVYKIIRWWRRCSIELHKRKEAERRREILLAHGPAGQAQIAIEDIVSHAMRPRYWYSKMILEEDGVRLLEGIFALDNRLGKAYQRVKEGITDTRGTYNLSSRAVEELQDLLETLEKRKKYLGKTRSMFSQKAHALYEMPVEMLQEKMSTARGLLTEFQQDMKKWEGEIEYYFAGKRV